MCNNTRKGNTPKEDYEAKASVQLYLTTRWAIRPKVLNQDKYPIMRKRRVSKKCVPRGEEMWYGQDRIYTSEGDNIVLLFVLED